jgi:hypothetical protein
VKEKLTTPPKMRWEVYRSIFWVFVIVGMFGIVWSVAHASGDGIPSEYFHLRILLQLVLFSLPWLAPLVVLLLSKRRLVKKGRRPT